MTRIVALVPMRHHSQRVPGKNYRPLAGKPLFHHIIGTLLDVPEIAEVVVNTDSPEVTGGLREHFPTVNVIARPEHLRAADIPMNEILAYDTSQVEADFFLQTHSTNPLLRAKTISRAIQSLIPKGHAASNYPAYDSLFSVTRLQTRLWDQLTRPINHNPAILLQTQDLPLVYEENSCIYIFTRETLLARRNRLGERPLMFEIPRLEAWDIDDEWQFRVAEILLEVSR